MTIDQLPDILTAQHIASYLGISRRRVYELLEISSEHGGLKVKTVAIGISKRVAKDDFLDWFESRKGA
jgi:DNA-binding transcriptional regulator LsrR (DeoR family)